MVTDLLLVKLVHTHLNNDIEIINGLESVHPQKCMDKSKHNCSFWHLGSPFYGLQSLFTFSAAWGTHNYSSRSLHTSIRIGFYISLSNCTHRSWWCLPRQAGFGAAGCSCRGWRWRRGSRRRAARNWWWSGRTEADTGQHGVFRTLHLAHLDSLTLIAALMKDRASESPPAWQLSCSLFLEQCSGSLELIKSWTGKRHWQ